MGKPVRSVLSVGKASGKLPFSSTPISHHKTARSISTKRIMVPKAAKKDKGTQLHLDFGQPNFDMRVCKECGMKYAPGVESDERIHTRTHDIAVNGVLYSPWKAERALWRAGKDSVVAVDSSSPASHQKKVEEVAQQMRADLGDAAPACPSSGVALLYISRGRIAGCCMAVPLTHAYTLDASTPGSMSVDTSSQHPAVCGVSHLWVKQPYRRKGIASRLLDCVRVEYSEALSPLPKSLMAFSQPTAQGHSIATKYFGVNNYLVYIDHATHSSA